MWSERGSSYLYVKQFRLGDSTIWMQIRVIVLSSLSLVRRNASCDHFGENGEFLASQAISGIRARD
jgi:hypothetical protein